MFRRSVLAGMACAALVIATAGYEPPAQAQSLAKEQIVRFGLGFSDIATLDPQFAVGSSEAPIIKDVFEGLVNFPAGELNGDKVVPGLAERWEASPDKKQWKFYLRRGVQWHKGFGEFTAEDVKYSFNRVMSKSTGSPFQGNLQNIERIDIVNPYLVGIVLKQPDPTFLHLMAGFAAGYIMSKNAADRQNDSKLNPIGTGPFVLSQYKARESVTLVRNDNFWRGKPIIERVVYQFMPEASTRELALKSGEVHGITVQAKQDVVDRLRRGGFAVDLTSPANSFTLYLNVTKKPLDDVRVRRAFAHATDRANLVAFLGKDLARPEYSALPLAYTGYSLPTYPYDVAKARALLAEAGLPKGFNLSVNMSNSDIYLPTMQVIQEQWKKIGVNLELKVVDHPTYHRLIRDDANPIVLYGAYRFPMTGRAFLDQFYAGPASIGRPGAITNFSHYGDAIKGVDNLLDKARYNPDPMEQTRLWAEAQKKIAQDAVSIQLYTQYYAMARVKTLDLGHAQKSFSFYQLTEKSKVLDR